MSVEIKQKYIEIMSQNYINIKNIFDEYKRINIKPKKAKKKLLVFMVLFTLFSPLVIYPAAAIVVLLYDKVSLVKLITNIILILIIILPIWMIIKSNKRNKKRLHYEEVLYPIITKQIIYPVFENTLTNFEYEHTKGIDVYTFIQASLNERYDRFYSNDYIRFGMGNNTLFEASNVLTETEERDDEGNTYYSTKFIGLVGKLNLPININAKVEISSLKGDKNKISVDMDEFEKYFEVTSNDEIKALQILTHDVMLKLIEIREKYNLKYDLVLSNNTMYIRLYDYTIFEIRKYEDFQNDMYDDITKVINIKNMISELFNTISELVI